MKPARHRGLLGVRAQVLEGRLRIGMVMAVAREVVGEHARDRVVAVPGVARLHRLRGLAHDAVVLDIVQHFEGDLGRDADDEVEGHAAPARAVKGLFDMES